MTAVTIAASKPLVQRTESTKRKLLATSRQMIVLHVASPALAGLLCQETNAAR